MLEEPTKGFGFSKIKRVGRESGECPAVDYNELAGYGNTKGNTNKSRSHCLDLLVRTDLDSSADKF